MSLVLKLLKSFDLCLCQPYYAPFDFSIPFEIMCDESEFAIGVFLNQRVNRMPHVRYYASRTLTDVQKNHSTTKKELLAVVFTLDKFHP